MSAPGLTDEQEAAILHESSVFGAVMFVSGCVVGFALRWLFF